MNSKLEAKIEALLLQRGEPQSLKALAAAADATPEDLSAALGRLKERYAEHASGICLVEQGTHIALGTAPELHSFIESCTKAEYEKELGPAALETLALVLYQAPITRTTIDRIRGVHSSYILRHLLIRGLIQRSEDPAFARSFVYAPTVELFAYLGITKAEDLPEGQKVREELTHYLASTQGD